MRRLPSIKIPLRLTDPDLRLSLQPLINLAYENGRYGSQINYSQQPEPELEAAEFAWTQELFKRIQQQTSTQSPQ